MSISGGRMSSFDYEYLSDTVCQPLSCLDLQDIANSKRITTAVHATKQELTGIKVTVLSELFWPPLASEPLKLPDEVITALSIFRTLFRTLINMSNVSSALYVDKYGMSF
jgi:hypothetical protein